MAKTLHSLQDKSAQRSLSGTRGELLDRHGSRVSASLLGQTELLQLGDADDWHLAKVNIRCEGMATDSHVCATFCVQICVPSPRTAALPEEQSVIRSAFLGHRWIGNFFVALQSHYCGGYRFVWSCDTP